MLCGYLLSAPGPTDPWRMEVGAMRTAYQEQLSAQCAQLGEMCGLAADAMEHATQALLGADLSLAEQVIADHEHIGQYHRRAEATAIRLLALQQPVAGDLRKVIGSSHISRGVEGGGGRAGRGRSSVCELWRYTARGSPDSGIPSVHCPMTSAPASRQWAPGQCN